MSTHPVNLIKIFNVNNTKAKAKKTFPIFYSLGVTKTLRTFLQKLLLWTDRPDIVTPE